MKEFFRSMIELQKINNKWVRKHWRGYIIYSVICAIIYLGLPKFVVWIINKIEEIKLKKQNEENETEEA